jgi:hypothetical protein
MFRDPKCTGGNSANYDGLIKATCCKMLLYLHGREDLNYTMKYGATTIESLNMDEFLKILKERHHTLSRNNAKKLKEDSSDTVVMNDQDSSNNTVVFSSPLFSHSSSSSNSSSLPNV